MFEMSGGAANSVDCMKMEHTQKKKNLKEEK